MKKSDSATKGSWSSPQLSSRPRPCTIAGAHEAPGAKPGSTHSNYLRTDWRLLRDDTAPVRDVSPQCESGFGDHAIYQLLRSSIGRDAGGARRGDSGRFAVATGSRSVFTAPVAKLPSCLLVEAIARYSRETGVPACVETGFRVHSDPIPRGSASGTAGKRYTRHKMEEGSISWCDCAAPERSDRDVDDRWK